MAKSSKKKIAKIPRGEKKKLPRGYKECSNCSTLLNIHKYVCDHCGHRHDMKRKKVDVLKGLSNLTPKLLRSLIELNDFNDVDTFTAHPNLHFQPSPLFKIDVPQQMRRRRSSKSVSATGNQTQNIEFIEGQGLIYSKFGGNLTSICTVGSEVVVAQSIEKWANMSESQKITIRAYDLDKYHKLGQCYKGKSSLSIMRGRKVTSRITINEHLQALRSISNRVAALTGKGTIIILDLDDSHESKEVVSYQYRESLQVIVPDDQITTFEWLRGQSHDNKSVLVVGTLMGHLYLFAITKAVQLIRFICNAHFETITAAAECPLSTREETIFATGSFDGGVAVWSYAARECLYRMQASNRKILSLLWDPGAKFILVVRDESQDSGLLACFFAIHKGQESVTLSDEIDFRLVKCSPNTKTSYCGFEEICLVDTYNCIARILATEQLRKNSLKRKKVKREQQQRSYTIKLPGRQLPGSEQEKINSKNLPVPVIGDYCMVEGESNKQLWGVTYDGLLFILPIK